MGVFTGLENLGLCVCGILSPGVCGVFGTGGSGDIGLGGVCPVGVGVFWRSDDEVTIGRIIPGTRLAPAFGGGNGAVFSGSSGGGGNGTVSSASIVVAFVVGSGILI